MKENTVEGEVDKMLSPLNYIEALKVLTPREIEVLELISDGYSGNVIANQLFISAKTVYKHKI